MKRILLKRVIQLSNVTQGVLVDNDTGYGLGVTLELPWTFNLENISCIPEGSYHCLPTKNSKGNFVFRLQDVLNRTCIDMHIGNTVLKTLGCILVGQRFGRLYDLPAVLDSKLMFVDLRDYVDNKDFALKITNV